MEYPTVEHAFNAQKVADDDPKVEEYRLTLSTNISDVLTPNAAKKFGKESFKEDDFTLTSNNYIWTYPGRPYTPNSIIVMPEETMPVEKICDMRAVYCYGVCTDYPSELK